MKTAGIDIGTTTISGVVLEKEENGQAKILEAKTVENGCFIETGNEWERIQYAKEIVEKLGEEELFMMPMMVEDEMAQEVYNLNLDDVVDYGILVPGITAQQDEIIVVKAKEGKVDDVKASLEEHLKDLLSQRLYPTYMEAAEEAKVEVNGDLVSLFILDSEIKESVEEQYYKLIKK